MVNENISNISCPHLLELFHPCPAPASCPHCLGPVLPLAWAFGAFLLLALLSGPRVPSEGILARLVLLPLSFIVVNGEAPEALQN